uniref:Uncharacterized protein n=1 Tax=Octactis speculum TaxID=3111310 RepID=A0A7S2DMZ5_9STRA
MLTTASLTPKGITSFQDCIDQSCVACTNVGMLSELESIFGSTGVIFETLTGGTGGWSDVPEQLESGQCDIGLMDTTSFQISRADGFKELCDWRFIGEALFWIPLGMPVTNDIAPGLNYWLRDIVNDGTYEDIFDGYIPSLSSACDPFMDSDATSVMAKPLDLHPLYLPSIFCVILAFFALLIDLHENGWQSFKDICTMRFGMHGQCRGYESSRRMKSVNDTDMEMKSRTLTKIEDKEIDAVNKPDKLREAVKDFDETDMPKYLLALHSQILLSCEKEKEGEVRDSSNHSLSNKESGLKMPKIRSVTKPDCNLYLDLAFQAAHEGNESKYDMYLKLAKFVGYKPEDEVFSM